MGQTPTIAFKTSLLAQAELSNLSQLIYLAHVCAELKPAGEATLKYDRSIVRILIFQAHAEILTYPAGRLSLSILADQDLLPQIVFVTTEVDPWSKVGGLADVLSALPPALAARQSSCHPHCASPFICVARTLPLSQG